MFSATKFLIDNKDCRFTRPLCLPCTCSNCCKICPDSLNGDREYLSVHSWTFLLKINFTLVELKLRVWVHNLLDYNVIISTYNATPIRTLTICFIQLDLNSD